MFLLPFTSDGIKTKPACATRVGDVVTWLVDRKTARKNVENVLTENVSRLRLEDRLHRAGLEQTYDIGVASCANKMWIVVFLNWILINY